MRSPRILLVDSNVSAAPIYRYLVGTGAEVFVVGGRSDDTLARLAKHYVELDYADADALAALAGRLDIDHLVPGCNDRSYLSCAEVAQQLPFRGIDSVKATQTLNDKANFRRFAQAIGIPVPRVFPEHCVETADPVIVKPVDAFSGRGTTVVRNGDRAALDAAIASAKAFSRTGSCIVEAFLAGRLYSHSAFITGRAIVADFIVEEHGTANPFVVDTSRLDYAFSPGVLAAIRAEVIKMAEHLNLCDGLVHTQFLLDGERFWFVEVTRRCPGDLYSQLIELSTGFPYCEAYARPFIGKPAMAPPAAIQSRRITRHTVSLPVEQGLEALEFKMPLHIVKWVPLALAGDTIRPSPFSRIGLLFADSDTQAEQDRLFDRMLGRSLYQAHGLIEDA